MPERRWRVANGGGRGRFVSDVDDGRGFRPATTPEVDAALRQRELFGAADYPADGRNPPADERPPAPAAGKGSMNAKQG